jgi:hypothetical protein
VLKISPPPEIDPLIIQPVALLPHLVPTLKAEWSYTSTPRLYLHGVDRDNFTLLPLPTRPCTSTKALLSFMKVRALRKFKLSHWMHLNFVTQRNWSDSTESL